jgi:hypothetical protein
MVGIMMEVEGNGWRNSGSRRGMAGANMEVEREGWKKLEGMGGGGELLA